MQWKKDGAAIEGATSPSFTKSNAQKEDAGSYVAEFTNKVGTTPTNAATVVVNDEQPAVESVAIAGAKKAVR